MLAIDKNGKLVVVELKRNEDGGHMELQSIRYAAMVSTLTFDRAVDVFARYLKKIGREDQDARATILDFLEWDEPDDDRFAQDTRIVLASAEFSPEITSSVLWLIDHGVSIRRVRLKPYNLDGRLLVDVQQIIPLPEAEEYQVQFREKAQKERQARASNVDFTKFDVHIGEELYTSMWKRNAIFQICKFLCGKGINPMRSLGYLTGASTEFGSPWIALSTPPNLKSGHLNKPCRVERVLTAADGSVMKVNWFTQMARHMPFQINGAGQTGMGL